MGSFTARISSNARFTSGADLRVHQAWMVSPVVLVPIHNVQATPLITDRSPAGRHMYMGTSAKGLFAPLPKSSVGAPVEAGGKMALGSPGMLGPGTGVEARDGVGVGAGVGVGVGGADEKKGV